MSSVDGSDVDAIDWRAQALEMDDESFSPETPQQSLAVIGQVSSPGFFVTSPGKAIQHYNLNLTGLKFRIVGAIYSAQIKELYGVSLNWQKDLSELVAKQFESENESVFGVFDGDKLILSALFKEEKKTEALDEYSLNSIELEIGVDQKLLKIYLSFILSIISSKSRKWQLTCYHTAKFSSIFQKFGKVSAVEDTDSPLLRCVRRYDSEALTTMKKSGLDVAF